MASDERLFIPVVLGTTRQGRLSEHVARYVASRVKLLPDVDTEIVDVARLPLSFSDSGEAIKDASFSETMMRADGIVLVTPEYNHGYPGPLKHALDSNLKEYIHKAVGICGVSAGPWGDTRVVENLLPVLRELGLVTIFWDGNFPNVGKLFDRESGEILDREFDRRMDKFLRELVWMAKVLRYGRREVAL